MVAAAEPSPLLEQVAALRLQNAALRAQNAVLQEPIRELEARLGRNLMNPPRGADQQCGRAGAAPGRAVAQGSFGADSEAGSRCSERVLTVAASCRQQGRQLLDFPVAAGEAATRGTRPPCLLPAPQGN